MQTKDDKFSMVSMILLHLYKIIFQKLKELNIMCCIYDRQKFHHFIIVPRLNLLEFIGLMFFSLVTLLQNVGAIH